MRQKASVDEATTVSRGSLRSMSVESQRTSLTHIWQSQYPTTSGTH